MFACLSLAMHVYKLCMYLLDLQCICAFLLSLCSETHKDKTPRLTNASRPKPAASAVSAPRTVPENNQRVMY